ncbi:MAG: serine/threonine-protein kinase [Bryobacteraceae bacterium]
MDRERFERIKALFLAAAGHSQPDCRAILEAQCGGDSDLKARVWAMLEADRADESLLDRGLPEIAYSILGAPIEEFPVREIGPYRLKKKLGQGGMGVVYLAEREDTGTPVAIKFLLHAGMSAPRRESFAREVRTLASLKHPYIARLYDAGSLPDGTPWFVMEHVEGTRLTDYCREHNLAIDEKVRLFRAVCEAVQHAYRQGIIHRDLKPSNILVEKDGTPRLLDFGVARQLHNAGEPAAEAPGELRLGSPEYAAPEWTRDGIVTSYTDVYSLGVILYEVLAGRLPVASERANPPDSARGSGESKGAGRRDLDALCRKAMHPEAQQRYQSVEELIRDVDHHLKCEPLDARQGSWAYRAGKFVKRNRRGVLAASVVLALFAVVVVSFAVRVAIAKNVAVAEAARARSIQRFMLNLFESGKPDAAFSKDLRALTLLERGVKAAGSLNADPETQAELYESLGSEYDMLGSFQESERLLRLALDRMKTALGPEDPKIAEVLLKLGILRGDQSQIGDALRFAQDGLTLALRHAAPQDRIVVEARSVLGRVTAQSGSFEKAIAILEPLVGQPVSGEEATYNLADNLTVLGVCSYELGRIEKAEEFDRRALALHRQVAGEFHPRTATDLVNLAMIEAARSHYAEAEKYYRSAIPVMEGWYGRDHPDTATFMGLLARVLLWEGKAAEAEGMLKRVLEVQERAYGGVDVRIAVTLDSLGRIVLQRGELAAAEADFRRAFQIAQAILGERNPATAFLKSDLGDVHVRQGTYVVAQRELEEALKVLQDTRPSGDSHTGAAELSLGRCLMLRQRFAEAEKHLAAGYGILAKQAHPPPDRMREARQDLAVVYTALKQPAKAEQFRAAGR